MEAAASLSLKEIDSYLFEAIQNGNVDQIWTCHQKLKRDFGLTKYTTRDYITGSKFGNDEIVFWATWVNITDAMKALIDLGYAVDIKDSRDMTPLMHAAFHGQVEMIMVILEAPSVDVECYNDTYEDSLDMVSKKYHGGFTGAASKAKLLTSWQVINDEMAKKSRYPRYFILFAWKKVSDKHFIKNIHWSIVREICSYYPLFRTRTL
mmetsp:Transcript_43190/g.49654  ORF Transcript_43190/g.49654 Transcript_43190/m.49654 type:complete len:207 (-) Transcript_43190:874-1494(-)